MTKNKEEDLNIILKDESFQLLFSKPIKKGEITEDQKRLTKMIVSVREEKNISLDQISLGLGIGRSKITKLIKETGFVWNKKTKSYSEGIFPINERVDLGKKKLRKKVTIKLDTSTAKLLDYILEERECTEEVLFKSLIEETVKHISSREVIDIFSDS